MDFHSIAAKPIPKFSPNYVDTGGGRDFQIIHNSGGFINPKNISVHQSQHVRSKSNKMVYIPFKATKYEINGSGRDTYIAVNSGGLQVSEKYGVSNEIDKFKHSLRNSASNNIPIKLYKNNYISQRYRNTNQNKYKKEKELINRLHNNNLSKSISSVNYKKNLTPEKCIMPKSFLKNNTSTKLINTKNIKLFDTIDGDLLPNLDNTNKTTKIKKQCQDNSSKEKKLNNQINEKSTYKGNIYNQSLEPSSKYQSKNNNTRNKYFPQINKHAVSNVNLINNNNQNDLTYKNETIHKLFNKIKSNVLNRKNSIHNEDIQTKMQSDLKMLIQK